uniref:Uncharacterized protein n=1 Tax=Electrophorus electricus TaxID=8005 RepID=A0AAY5F4M9_ELEEL
MTVIQPMLTPMLTVTQSVLTVTQPMLTVTQFVLTVTQNVIPWGSPEFFLCHIFSSQSRTRCLVMGTSLRSAIPAPAGL